MPVEMLRSTCVTYVLLVSVAYAALPLPSYMKPCARNDPNLNACIVEHGKAAIPELIKGERKYGIPLLDPVELTDIKIPSSNLQIDFRNVKVHGLKDADLKEADFDLKQMKVRYEILFPELTVLGEYEMDGRILLLPITGKGDANITLDNANTTVTFDIRIVKIEEKDHFEFSNFKTQIEPKRVYFKFTNLFDGNKLLGDEMNDLLEREWRDAYRDFGPAVVETANIIIQKISEGFFKKVPVDAWFPEKV